jgi:hypothetical protein
MLQLLQRLPQFRNLLQQFKKSEVSTDNNFRDFNVMDQAILTMNIKILKKILKK